MNPQIPEAAAFPVAAVTHVVISLDHGGLERLVVDWTNERNRRRPGSTRILCLDKPGELASQVEPDAVDCLHARRSRFPFDLSAVLRLRRLRIPPREMQAPGPGCHAARGERVLHSHNLAAQQYAALASMLSGLRHVHTEHGSNPHVRGMRNRLRLRLVARMTDRIVAVSESTAKAMLPLWGLAPAAVAVIPNGITPHRDCPAEETARLRDALAIPESARVIGSVGRLAGVKGYDRLLRSLSTVLRPPSAVYCLLVGDGSERGALEKLALDLGIRERVIFTGYREEARRFLDVMDLFVLPSRSEGLSIALLEAMAAGRPVAVTDVGENRRVVDDGRAGILLADDEDTWGDTLQRTLVGDGQARARDIAGVAKSRVAECYALSATLDAYEGVYCRAEDRA